MAVIKADGSPVNPAHCIVPDHYLTTFLVEVRSLGGVSRNEIKDLIQKKFEVVGIELTNMDVVVK